MGISHRQVLSESTGSPVAKPNVDELRILNARKFICARCRRKNDDVMGGVKGVLRKCARCPRKLYALLIIQETPSDKKNKFLGHGKTPSSRIQFH